MADDDRPPRLGTQLGPGDVVDHEKRQPYAHYFKVAEHDVQFRRFDGTMSAVVTRAAFVMAEAVTVLPYDPVRDRVLLVEQFRFAPYVRGDARPWSLEPIAGRIDPGEGPEATARREALEEAGLTIGALHPIGAHYPSPGAVTEYLHSYIAITDLPDGAAGAFGLEAEAEDIKGHLLEFKDAFALIEQGEARNGPLLLSLYWLAAHRDALRSETLPK